MAKAAPYRLTWIPEQKIYALHHNSGEFVLSMTQDSQELFALLANILSFSFCGQHGQLTVRSRGERNKDLSSQDVKKARDGCPRLCLKHAGGYCMSTEQNKRLTQLS